MVLRCSASLSIVKRLISFLFVQLVFSASGFADNPRWKVGSPIPGRASLDVRWQVSNNKIPSTVWIYRLLPNQFSTQVVSNIMHICSFTEKERTKQNTNEVTFQNFHDGRTLIVSDRK